MEFSVPKRKIIPWRQDGENSLKEKVFGQENPGTSGTYTSGYPRPRPWDAWTKLCAKRLFSAVLDGTARMSCDLGRDIPGSEKLCARKLCADFSFPTEGYLSEGKFPQFSLRGNHIAKMWKRHPNV